MKTSNPHVADVIEATGEVFEMNFQPPEQDDPRDDEQRIIDGERAAFEKDAEPMGFDLTRISLPVPEPWSEYKDETTGHRWGGWLARALAAEVPTAEQVEAAHQQIREVFNEDDTPHPETPAPLRGEIDGDVKRVKEILARLCDQGLLSMSIPVRKDDEDMVLSRVINAVAAPVPQSAGVTDEQIKRIGQTLGEWIPGVCNYDSWPGMSYEKDEHGNYTVPGFPPIALKFARAVLALAPGLSGWVMVPDEKFAACKKALNEYSQYPPDYHRSVLRMRDALRDLVDATKGGK